MTDNEILNKLLEKESGPFDFDGNNCSELDGFYLIAKPTFMEKLTNEII